MPGDLRTASAGSKDQGAAWPDHAGVLVGVPVMLSVCAACDRTRGWFAVSIPQGS